jgi:hypothetical protein
MELTDSTAMLAASGTASVNGVHAKQVFFWRAYTKSRLYFFRAICATGYPRFWGAAPLRESPLPDGSQGRSDETAPPGPFMPVVRMGPENLGRAIDVFSIEVLIQMHDSAYSSC